MNECEPKVSDLMTLKGPFCVHCIRVIDTLHLCCPTIQIRESVNGNYGNVPYLTIDRKLGFVTIRSACVHVCSILSVSEVENEFIL